MSDVTEDFLEHYGVKGMKWGKRSAGSGGSSGGGSRSRKEIKTERKEVRKEMYSAARAKVRTNKGKTVASALLVGGSSTAGYALARGAGYSKGKSVAIAALGGAPGGMLAVNIAARKAVGN